MKSLQSTSRRVRPSSRSGASSSTQVPSTALSAAGVSGSSGSVTAGGVSGSGSPGILSSLHAASRQRHSIHKTFFIYPLFILKNLISYPENNLFTLFIVVLPQTTQIGTAPPCGHGLPVIIRGE
ncbi:hypothetical protein [uncultured Bacteroides sp.]|uniref:hypothetical protein n=1 Tax=uncultured Bacteroides sp. TaxID=162156 RepID=UPI0026382B40|nr:hypothetical protein [uncultured Bacteroides sp.]